MSQDVQNDKSRNQINVSLEKELYNSVVDYAVEHNWTLAQAMRYIIKHYFIQLRG